MNLSFFFCFIGNYNLVVCVFLFYILPYHNRGSVGDFSGVQQFLSFEKRRKEKEREKLYILKSNPNPILYACITYLIPWFIGWSLPKVVYPRTWEGPSGARKGTERLRRRRRGGCRLGKKTRKGKGAPRCHYCLLISKLTVGGISSRHGSGAIIILYKK